MRRYPHTSALRLLGLLLLAGCASYRPAPLSVRVNSVPKGAHAELRCPNVAVQSGMTPARFRIPQYATPCALTLSRDGYRDRKLDVTLDMLQQGPAPLAPPSRRPIHFSEEATPFSLIGALIVLGLENFGASVSERVSSAAVPDAEIEVVLETAGP